MTFNFLGPGLTVNVEAKVKEQIILDSSEAKIKAGQNRPTWVQQMSLLTNVLPEDEQYKLA